MDPAEFDKLVERHLDADLTSEEGQRLALVLKEDPAKAKQFARASAMHQQVRSMFRYERTVGSRVQGMFSQAHRWKWFSVGVLAASLVAVAAFLTHRQLKPNKPELATPQSVSPIPLAYLASSNGCNWGTLATPAVRELGSGVRPGDEIALFEGIAEFRLSNMGISLHVEGPAAFLLTSHNSLVLRQGKITVKVPWNDSDFTVMAGACRVKARDTEFGIEVIGNDVHIHTFLGELTAMRSPFFAADPLQEPGPQFDPQDNVSDQVRVQQGEAVVFSSAANGSTHLQLQKADRNRFATQVSMGGRLPVTASYVSAITASKPIDYWRFESIEGGVVPNAIEGRHPLTIAGSLELSGDENNSVIELGRPQMSGYLLSERGILPRTNSYAFEMWMKPSHYHRGVLAALVKENVPTNLHPNKHGLMLELERGYESRLHPPGSIRFLHRSPPGTNFGTSCYSNRLYGIRQWQHIVAQKNKATMQLYIDGKPVATAKDALPLTSGLQLVLGQTYSSGEPVHPFIGQLDELAVYDRALTEEEIATHFKNVDFERLKQVEADGI